MNRPAPEANPLDVVAEALQAFVNATDEQAPVLVRGGVVAWESMIFNDDGDAMFKVNYAALPNTSAASTIGILDLATEVAKFDMFGDSEEEP